MRAALVSILWCAAIAACGDDGGNKAKPDAATPTIDAATPVIDAAVDLTHQSIELAGGANGLYWDDAAHTLYLTDENANTLLTYTDAAGIATVTALPVEASGSNPGGITRLASGTLLTPNFAMGTSAGNTLFTVDPAAKTSTALTGLDGSHHRIGIGVTSTGAIYDTYFAGMGAGNQTGSVATIVVGADGSATETDLTFAVAPGFKKLVGMIVTDDAVFVTDQTQLKVFKIALADNTVTTVGAVTSADLMTLLPGGDLITGGTGGVRRLTQAGVETTLFTGETFDDVHGNAYDPTGKRLFFINHSSTAGTKDRLEVRPLAN
ncbi:MAG TPA: hypothetical protein VH165_35265 [Kofleriaceae bacterium]|jgi:CBS domain-containing protein|nr:hypothetical protein [Kofleriaceae bacterium]